MIEPSQSEWWSPIVLVPKPDGSIHFCIDFWEVNKKAKFDTYPMPRADILLNQVGKASYLSSLDLTKGYWQVPLWSWDRKKTAFATPQELFHFTVMPFGFHRAAATFQRLVDCVLGACRSFCMAYLDDILVFSRTWHKHLNHLRKVLQAIRDTGLRANPKKSILGTDELRYLGNVVGQGWIAPRWKR